MIHDTQMRRASSLQRVSQYDVGATQALSACTGLCVPDCICRCGWLAVV